MNQERLDEAASQYLVMFAGLEQRGQEQIRRTALMMEKMERGIASIRTTQAQVLDEASARVDKTVSEGVRRALGQAWTEFDREVQKTLSRLQEGSQEAVQSRQTANRHAKWLSLKALAVVGACMAVLIGGGALVLMMELKQVNAASARLEAIEIRADVAEASRHVTITSCGGRPCIRLEADTPRWGRDGEYVLVDGK